MSFGLVALIFGIGVGAWIYNKMAHRTANDYSTSLIVAGIGGCFAAFALFLFMHHFFH